MAFLHDKTSPIVHLPSPTQILGVRAAMLAGEQGNGVLARSISDLIAGIGGEPAVPAVPAQTTILLNHFDGLDGATTPADEVGGITWDDGSGAFEVDTGFSRFGGASLINTNAFGAPAIGSGFADPSAGDWTMEGWQRVPSNGQGCNFELWPTASSNNRALIGILSSTTIVYALFDGSGNQLALDTPTVVATPGNFYHMAIVRSGTVYYVLFDGVRIAALGIATNIGAVTRVALEPQASVANSHWDDIRVSVGALYTGPTYTVPAMALEVENTPGTPEVPEVPPVSYEQDVVEASLAADAAFYASPVKKHVRPNGDVFYVGTPA